MRDDEPCGLGRILELTRADRGQRQVAERAAALPALVARLGDHAFGLGRRIEPFRVSSQSTRASRARASRALGVEEVVGERARVLLREAERPDPLLDLHGGEHTCGVVPLGEARDGVPQTDGWFVVNARDPRWKHNELGAYCGFEGKDDAAFDQLGINLNVLRREADGDVPRGAGPGGVPRPAR